MAWGRPAEESDDDLTRNPLEGVLSGFSFDMLWAGLHDHSR